MRVFAQNVGRYAKLQTDCNMPIKSTTARILHIANVLPLVRARDVEARGIPREYLLRLYRQGLLRRAARGVYALAEASVNEHHSLAVVSKVVPHAVVCLLSALRFHGLTTQDPHQIWIAINNKARRPSLETPSLRVVRFGLLPQPAFIRMYVRQSESLAVVVANGATSFRLTVPPLPRTGAPVGGG
jgi:predicted transcriptional regulator of viral defense system